MTLETVSGGNWYAFLFAALLLGLAAGMTRLASRVSTEFEARRTRARRLQYLRELVARGAYQPRDEEIVAGLLVGRDR